MAEKETIDAEVTNVTDVNEEETKKEKKPGFFSKMKTSLNNQLLENKIEQAYKDGKDKCAVFTRDALFPHSVWGVFDGNKLTVWGNEEPKPYSVLIDEKDKAYYVIGHEKTTVKSVVEGVEYEREGTIITLDENVTEVKVVKAGDRYFLYKGEDK